MPLRVDIDSVRGIALFVTCVSVLGCAPNILISGPPLPFRAVIGPVIVAHQTGALEAPENTLAGVRHSVESGADWVEVSVTLSADDRVVVIGDNRLERTTNGRGLVRATRLRELKRLSAGRPEFTAAQRQVFDVLSLPEPGFEAHSAQESIPTLSEVLEATEARVLIRLEPGTHVRRLAHGTVDAIVRARADDRVALCSSELELLERASSRHGGIPLFALVSTIPELNEALILPLQGVLVPHRIFDEAMETVPMGLAVWVGPLRETTRIEQIALAGGHGILTDLPKRVVKHLRPPVELHIRRPHERR